MRNEALYKDKPVWNAILSGLLIPSLYLMHMLMGFAGIAAAHTVADV